MSLCRSDFRSPSSRADRTLAIPPGFAAKVSHNLQLRVCLDVLALSGKGRGRAEPLNPMENKISHAPHEGISGADTATEKNTTALTAQQSMPENSVTAPVAQQGTRWSLSTEHREMLEQESSISPEAI